MDQNTPTVSVIMATYRGDGLRNLREAVGSIGAQTLTDFELIIVCDGRLGRKNDRLLDELCQRDPRVSVIRLSANEGQAFARNRGIAEARGEFVAIADADDVSEPHRLERQVAFLRETGADVAGSFYRVIDEEGNVIGHKQVPVSPASIRRIAFLFDPLPNPSVMARAEVLKANPYKAGYRFGEDYHLWVRLLRKGYDLRNQPEYLVRFRAGRQFLARRRGFSRFWPDLRIKLRTFPLYPWYAWPIVALGIAMSSGARLLPCWCLAGVYALRNRCKYADGSPVSAD